MKTTDRIDQQLAVGDRIIYGADNGSTLNTGIITKLTPMYVFFISERWRNGCRREYNRVCKIPK